MSTPMPVVIAYCGLLTALIGLLARIAIEGDVLDSLLLCGVCFALGYMTPGVFA